MCQGGYLRWRATTVTGSGPSTRLQHAGTADTRCFKEGKVLRRDREAEDQLVGESRPGCAGVLFVSLLITCGHLHPEASSTPSFFPAGVESSPSLAPASPSLLTTKSSIGAPAAKLQAISQTAAAAARGPSRKRRGRGERNADEGGAARRRQREVKVPGEISTMKV